MDKCLAIMTTRYKDLSLCQYLHLRISGHFSPHYLISHKTSNKHTQASHLGCFLCTDQAAPVPISFKCTAEILAINRPVQKLYFPL